MRLRPEEDGRTSYFITGIDCVAKDINVSFQTTSEVYDALEKIAGQDGEDISTVVESIVRHYLKDNRECRGIHQNRRSLDRKKVRFQAFIGDPRWQRQDFEECSVLEISFGGIRLSVPKGTKIEIQSDIKEIRVIFSLADCPWPINLKCRLQWVSEFDEEVLIGASLVDPDFYTYTTLQRYLI